jgi:hypothetical protein
VGAVPRFCNVYIEICLTFEEISPANLSQGNQRAHGRLDPNAVLLGDLVPAGDGLDVPAGPYRDWFSREAMG